MTLARIFLCLLVLLIPNQLHLPDALVKGVNPLNLATLLAIIAVLRLPKAVPPLPPPPLKGSIAMLIAALAYGFVVAVAGDASEWVGDLTFFKNAVFFPLLFFLFYHGIRDKTTARLVFASLLFVTAIAGVEAIREGFAYGNFAYNHVKRASGPFGTDYRSANLAAVFFCMFFPLFGAVVLFAKGRPVVRLLAAGGAAIVVFGTFFTYSRQAFVILAVCTLLLGARRNLLVAALAGFLLLSYQAWAPDAVVERIEMTDQADDLSYSEKRYDQSTESRFILWDAAYRMFIDHPAGVGLVRFKRYVGEYAPDFPGFDAHNFYMLFLAEGGVPGIVLFALSLLGIARFAWQAGRSALSDEAKVLAIGFQLSFVATLLGNLYGSRLLDGAVSGNFWILAAVVARYLTLDAAERSRTVPRPRFAPVPARFGPEPACARPADTTRADARPRQETP